MFLLIKTITRSLITRLFFSFVSLMAAPTHLRIKAIESLNIPPKEGLCNQMFIGASSAAGHVKTVMFMRCSVAANHTGVHHCNFHTIIRYNTDGLAGAIETPVRPAGWPNGSLSYDKLIPENGNIVPLLTFTHTQMGEIIESYDHLAKLGYDFKIHPTSSTGCDIKQLETLVNNLQIAK